MAMVVRTGTLVEKYRIMKLLYVLEVTLFEMLFLYAFFHNLIGLWCVCA